MKEIEQTDVEPLPVKPEPKSDIVDVRFAKFQRRAQELSEANISYQMGQMVNAGVLVKLSNWSTPRKTEVYMMALELCKMDAYIEKTWKKIQWLEGKASGSDKKEAMFLMSCALTDVAESEFKTCSK